MARFFLFLLMLPWWLYFPLAGGVVWLGEHVYESALQDEAERKLALAEGPPAPVDAALFDRERDAGAANEVNISGWVNFDYNYELIRKRNGITTGRAFMYVLFGEQDGPESRTPRMVIVMKPEEKDAFVEKLDEYVTGFAAQGPILTVNGTLGSNGFLSLVNDALRDEGLATGNVVTVEPFVYGREAALSVEGVPEQTRYAFWLGAAVVALFGLGRFAMRNRTAQRKDVFADGPVAGVSHDAAAPVKYTFNQPRAPLAENVSPDSPLARINARLEKERAPVAPVRTAEMASENSIAARDEKPVRGRSGRRALAGGVVVIAAGFVALQNPTVLNTAKGTVGALLEDSKLGEVVAELLNPGLAGMNTAPAPEAPATDAAAPVEVASAGAPGCARACQRRGGGQRPGPRRRAPGAGVRAGSGCRGRAGPAGRARRGGSGRTACRGDPRRDSRAHRTAGRTGRAGRAAGRNPRAGRAGGRGALARAAGRPAAGHSRHGHPPTGDGDRRGDRAAGRAGAGRGGRDAEAHGWPGCAARTACAACCCLGRAPWPVGGMGRRALGTSCAGSAGLRNAAGGTGGLENPARFAYLPPVEDEGRPHDKPVPVHSASPLGSGQGRLADPPRGDADHGDGVRHGRRDRDLLRVGRSADPHGFDPASGHLRLRHALEHVGQTRYGLHTSPTGVQ